MLHGALGMAMGRCAVSSSSECIGSTIVNNYYRPVSGSVLTGDQKYVAQTLLSVPAFCRISVGHRQERLCHIRQMEFRPKAGMGNAFAFADRVSVPPW